MHESDRLCVGLKSEGVNKEHNFVNQSCAKLVWTLQVKTIIIQYSLGSIHRHCKWTVCTVCCAPFVPVRISGYESILQGRPCSLVCGSHDSLGVHIHLCLFAKFDFKYLLHHTSWLKQIGGKVLLSVEQVVRRMETLEGTSMFHLVKYMTEKYMCKHNTFETGEGL